ncbi:SCO family protein [Flavobacterium ajazii]|uniref:SCO family protein n=1 Tax=Flavobacterium ajazii TaxID=2692318 RepID=UPI0013D1DCD1|nr:SCO family protein [Flavobacterium ajazii]
MFWKRKDNKTLVTFGKHTSEENIAAFVDEVRANPELRNELLPLLRESHVLYNGRGTQECIRLRGYILAAFEVTGLPPAALIFAMEDLYNTRSAYLIAGAARAIRGMAQPHPEVVPYLLEAVVNIRYMDDAVTFDTYKPVWPVTNFTTGLSEVFKTFAWLGAYAQEAIPQLKKYAEASDFQYEVLEEIKRAIETIEGDPHEVDFSCCGPSPKLAGRKETVPGRGRINPLLKNIVMEDQNGAKVPFSSFFQGKPTVVSFFYTRCIAINKCSLTVGNTGRLAKALLEVNLQNKVNVALITYDPVYDLPERIRVYAETRRCEFSDSFKAFRVSPGDYELLKEHFSLEVGYSTSIVNQHQVETYLLDYKGRIRNTLIRIQWSEDEIRDKIGRLIKEIPAGKVSQTAKAVSENLRTIVFPLLIAVFPKCPVCWAAYMSAFGIAGMKAIPYSPWLVPLFVLGIGVNLWLLYRARNKRNGLTPFWVSVLGAATFLICGLWLNLRTGTYVGIVFILLGSILNSLSFSWFQRLQGWVESLFRPVIVKKKQKLKTTT